MALWWVGNAVLVVVVLPAVIVIMKRVRAPAASIKNHADGLAVVGGSIVNHLDSVYGLLETQRLVGETGAGLDRYGTALDDIL